MIDLDWLAKNLHLTAIDKGFWPEVDDRTPDVYVAKMMMVVTEAAEIVEAYRKQQGSERIADEFADIFIRLLDVWDAMREAELVDGRLEDAISKKAEVNMGRPAMHGNLI